MKIMIVEDDIDINNLLKELLNEEGYEITQCFTAREALLMEISEFDLILLDLMMPFMSGEDFIKEVRERGMSIPIIVLSAKIDKETRIGVLKDGADDFITKPFDFDDVLARVEANIRRYRDFTKEIKKLEVK
uniref:response regulator transcription factor n=1 Tax=Peptoniphilus duerdenii TaxID=507750 RepID=UPI0023F03963